MTKQNYSTRMDGEDGIALEDVEDGEAGKAGRPVVGRESEYREEYAVQAMKLCRLGATYEDLADFFGVTATTLNHWQCTHPEFRDSVKRGKIIADVAAANRLYTRACGYSCKAVKIITHKGITHRVEYMKHYPPDTHTDCQKILPKRDSWGFEFLPLRGKKEFRFRRGNPGSCVVLRPRMFIHVLITPWNRRFCARPFGNPFWQPV